MSRDTKSLNDYITRREAHALIVHVVNEVFAQMAEPAVEQPSQTVPTDSEGAES